jgi:hypothetical protein
MKPPITNCHTHVFTNDYVPPLLGKGVLPSPVHWLAHLGAFIWILRYVVMPIRRPDKTDPALIHQVAYRVKEGREWLYDKYTYFPIVPRMAKMVQYVLACVVILIVLQWVYGTFSFGESQWGQWFNQLFEWIFTGINTVFFKNWLRIAFVVLVVLFLKSARNLLLFVLKYLFRIPGKLNTALFQRYLQLGEFAKYRQQQDILDRLEDQYPEGTRFVVLPMDMNYMKAGSPRAVPAEYESEYEEMDRRGTYDWHTPERLLLQKNNYLLQLEKLRDLKRTRGEVFKPFVFAHPERIRSRRRKGDQKPYFDYTIADDGEVILEDCWLKRYLEPEDSDLQFAGIKMYPALGYYPFDIDLLPLWKYAADKQIPIMTHCTMGTIFYRGMKKRAWNRHPVYRQDPDGDRYLRLSATRARNYQRHFSNPMNILCLLHPDLFAALLHHYYHSPEVTDDQKEMLDKLFGQPEERTRNLHQLKVCFGHYGGVEEWTKYLHRDRSYSAAQLRTRPASGSALAHSVAEHGKLSWYNARDAWENMDWYTMISSMMLQYPNIYADISYTLHDETIYPLLHQTLNHHRGEDPGTPPHLAEAGLTLPTHQLGERVLFGTDFYMIRSHKTDKELLAQTQALLSEAEFDQIARYNPQTYLQTTQ